MSFNFQETQPLGGTEPFRLWNVSDTCSLGLDGLVVLYLQSSLGVGADTLFSFFRPHLDWPR
jgi:hypothetical protein